MEAIVLPATYFGNLSYFKYILEADEIWIDDQEIYLKQTFRNRCQILAANGVLDLSVPIEGLKGKQSKYSDIKISYDDPWPTKHWRTIVSAYKSSPFFEEYEEDIKELILSEPSVLFEFNIKITLKLMELLQINKKINRSSELEIPEKALNFKGHFKPSKMPEEHKMLSPYIQVFNYKYDFVPNLSILDLLFNEGPYAQNYLLNQIQKK